MSDPEHFTPYVVAKGGVNQLTKTMSLSLAEQGHPGQRRSVRDRS